MKISIRNAIKNILSEKYNKNNLFLYFVLLFISSLISCYIQFNKGLDISITALLFGMSIIFLIITSGYYCVGVNEAIHKDKDIMPDLFKNIAKIAKTGISYYLSMLLVIIVSSLFYLVFFILKLPVITSVLAVCILYIVNIVIIQSLTLNFYESLDWKKLLNVKLAIELILKKEYWHFNYKLFLLLLLFVLVILVGSVVFSFIFTLIAPENQQASKILGSIIGCILGIVFSTIYIDLSAQLFKSIKQKEDNQ